MGKMIVIEGLDGSGKSTQISLLKDYLESKGCAYRQIKLPDYEDPSSTLVRMYLNGDFGKNPSDVNAYAASVFYCADRYASFKQSWGDFYNNGGVVVSGRYTTSNAVHQTSKLPREDWEAFLSWLYDFEYTKIGIPKPDAVIFLDMPVEVSQKLLDRRYTENGGKKDIHENDIGYLESCRRAAKFTADYSGWITVPCAEDGELRSIEEISDDILKEVLRVIK